MGIEVFYKAYYSKSNDSYSKIKRCHNQGKDLYPVPQQYKTTVFWFSVMPEPETFFFLNLFFRTFPSFSSLMSELF